MQISRKHDDDAGADQRAPRDPLAAHIRLHHHRTSPRLCLSSWVQHRILQHRDPTHSTTPSIARQSQLPSPNAPRTTGRPTPSTAHAIPHPTRSLEFKYSSLPPVSYCLPTIRPLVHPPTTEPTPRGPPAPTTQNPPPSSSPSFVVAPPTRDVPLLRLEPSPNSGCQFGDFPTQPSTLTSGLGTDASSTADELLQSLPDLVPSRAPGTAFCWRGRTCAAA
ncbi:MAG: hypothetical protein L6R36_004193 [Xanthoria steineri]|nr:MAG: hypothetical protein L6R36_004193 [Xanthoria steineri]